MSSEEETEQFKSIIFKSDNQIKLPSPKYGMTPMEKYGFKIPVKQSPSE